ncbi:MAG: hypothetical protein NTZ17_09640 [Phycisphaerae bacterium]|nr:hypothetical protein [Phycisphaerae bacterium]
MNGRSITLLTLAALASTTAWGKAVVTWDFTQGMQGWQGNQHVKNLTATAEGLAFESTGNDPWIEGPVVDLPGEGMTRVTVRMRSNADPGAELFYGRTFQAGRSVRFTVNNDGRWHEYSLVIPEPLGRAARFRLDPTTSEGPIVVGSIQVETLAAIQPPTFERPQKPQKTAADPFSINSGQLTLEHYRAGWGGFVVKVNGAEMAAGYQAEWIGVMLDDKPQWLQLQKADFTCDRGPDGEIVCRAVLMDSADGRWQVTRRFRAGTRPNTIAVQTECVVDQDRAVVYLPWLTLFPGLATFGERKTQGLLAGLEYLDDEPSSSEADITTPEHIRRVPDPVKITLPLMALAHEGRYLGLIWEPSEMAAAVFDSPDRTFNSGAHVMALTAPAVGTRRFENQLVAHTPFTLKANQPFKIQATLIGGSGDTIVPAVQKYVELRGLPKVPDFKGGFAAAGTLLAHGWLDSAINEGGLFRHAVWGDSFKAGPAGDAIMYMDWLAGQVQNQDLAGRLTEGRDLAMSKMPPGQPYSSAVSHTRTPTAPFVFGGLDSYVEQRRAEAQNLLQQFDEKGIKLYRPGKVDYGKTHFAQHANGLAAVDVVRILEAATLSADPSLIEQGLALLDKQTALYANTVPRGAQTWEVPLHTPDILASAYLVKAYTLGYIISGKREYLEQARYWAWTGVPFVYLANLTDGAIGPYATIAVLGATNWQAPVWFGRPVQWCGLVYGSALHLLSQYDKEGPWETIAKGITATGLQMTWPAGDRKRQGLLPDVFDLKAQLRDGPAINPGTVQAHVPELFGKGTLYDVKRLPKKGWFLHAPCTIRDLRETNDSITFIADGWDEKHFYVLLSGVQQKPTTVTIRPLAQATPAQAAADPARIDFKPQQRLLMIALDGPSEVQLR